MKTDDAQVSGQVKSFKLEKRDAQGGLFEVVEGGEGQQTRVTFRKPGQPPETYADLPVVDHEGQEK